MLYSLLVVVVYGNGTFIHTLFSLHSLQLISFLEPKLLWPVSLGSVAPFIYVDGSLFLATIVAFLFVVMIN